MREIILVVHNIRSTHNVGSLLRSADGLGINKVIFSGYTPYPSSANDSRLPHISKKMNSQIHKTALGAENSIDWENIDDLTAVTKKYAKHGYEIAALEQTDQAVDISEYQPPEKILLVVGNEVSGVDKNTLNLADTHLRIPMLGAKESFNVSVAAAIALYHLRYLV